MLWRTLNEEVILPSSDPYLAQQPTHVSWCNDSVHRLRIDDYISLCKVANLLMKPLTR